MSCITQCVSPKQLWRTFSSKTDSHSKSPNPEEIGRDTVSLLGKEEDIKKESGSIVKQTVAENPSDSAFCKIPTESRDHVLTATQNTAIDSICSTALLSSPDAITSFPSTNIGTLEEEASYPASVHASKLIPGTNISTSEGEASYPTQRSGTDIGPSDTDSTQSETEQLRTSLSKVKKELEQTRMKYLTEKSQVEYRETTLVNLALQFSGLLKSLQQKNKEVEALLADTKRAHAEKDGMQQDPGEAASDICEASDIQQEIKAEVDALRREVESHHAEMAKILHERAIEKERNDNEVRKLKAELVSLKFEMLENKLESNRDSPQESNGVTIMEDFFEQYGDSENRAVEVENGKAEGSKMPRKRKALSPQERRDKKDIKKSVAERGSKRRESPWVKIKSEWEITIPSEYNETTAAATLRKTYKGNFNKRKHKYYFSPGEAMESIPEQRYSQGRESVREFYERLYKTETESMLARKRSFSGRVSAKRSDEEPTKPPFRDPTKTSTRGTITSSKTLLSSSGTGMESGLPAFPSPRSVVNLRPSYRPFKSKYSHLPETGP